MEKKTKFHGYSTKPKGEREECVGLYIGHLPNRKGLCLYVSDQNKFCAHTSPLAYFKNEEAAKVCQRVLDLMILRIPEPTA